ncbi:hypothetical protein FACS189492_2470 [Clostridia bacterium]|nr:hypothetical protein FACS189492_2470 [Clostridia bacterium]
MNNNTIVLWVLITNTLIAIVVYILGLLSRNGKPGLIYSLVILVSPVVGPLFFGCAWLLLKLGLNVGGITYADISFDATRHVKKQKDNYLKEVDILPLEEAFAISKTADRRYQLLKVLKKDYSKNISTILSGLDNEDTETSHYAASVVLSTTTEYLNDLARLKVAYEKNRTELQPARAYLDCLKSFILSNIPDTIDKKKYLYIYLSVFDTIYDHYEESISDDDYVFVIELLIELGNRELAATWAERALRFFPDSSAIYYAILHMHYEFGDTERFFGVLDEIKNSDLNISNEILMIIRFFSYQAGQG